MAEKKYNALNGTKLEFSAAKNGAYTAVSGLKTIPDVGGAPNTIDTTCLDNTKYETAINGLIPVQSYEFEFNLEEPSTEANIKLVSDLEDNRTVAYWKLTYSSGITVEFRSDVRTTIKGGSSGDLEGFTMTLTPIDEPVRTIPV